MRLLLEVGGAVQLQEKNVHGALPVHCAADSNTNPEVMRLLLEVGGAEQLQEKAKHSQLPMHLAAMNNSNAEVVRLMLEVGGAEQLRAQTVFGALPMHCAAQFNSSAEVVRLLLEVGGAVQLQEKNVHGASPMHCAAICNSNAEVVRLLLGRGSARAARVDAGRSVVPAAIDRGREDIAELLIKAGVQIPPDVLRRLPQRWREAAARVSVSSVLSSYFADNISLLGAAVRSLTVEPLCCRRCGL